MPAYAKAEVYVGSSALQNGFRTKVKEVFAVISGCGRYVNVRTDVAIKVHE